MKDEAEWLFQAAVDIVIKIYCLLELLYEF